MRCLQPKTVSLEQAGGLQRMTLRGHAAAVHKVLLTPGGIDVITGAPSPFPCSLLARTRLHLPFSCNMPSEASIFTLMAATTQGIRKMSLKVSPQPLPLSAQTLPTREPKQYPRPKKWRRTPEEENSTTQRHIHKTRGPVFWPEARFCLLDGCTLRARGCTQSAYYVILCCSKLPGAC